MALEKIYSIGQSQTRTVYGGHISCMIGTTYGKCVQNLPYIIPTKYKFIVPPSFRGEYLLFAVNQKRGFPWRPCFFSNRDEMRKDAFYKMLLYLAKWFWRKFFFNWSTRKKDYLWQPCLLANRDKMSNHGGRSIDASYKVSVHLAKRLQRRIFLEIDQPETRIAYSGHVC